MDEVNGNKEGWYELGEPIENVPPPMIQVTANSPVLLQRRHGKLWFKYADPSVVDCGELIDCEVIFHAE